MFTENQVRQFYVATSTAADVIAPVKVDGNAETPVVPTDLSTKSEGACQFVIGYYGDEMYLNYKGPKDGQQRSDIIKKCNVIDVRLTDAADMKHPMKKVLVALASGVTIVKGTTYILNVEIKNYIANSYNSTKVKFGAAIAKTTTAKDLYDALAENLTKNFKREAAPLLTFTSTNNGIVIEEVEQPWRLGAAKQEFVDFEVYPSTVDVDGVETKWATVKPQAATTLLPNSKAVADMEYFFHKERGDVYGFAGFPYNIDTKYQVDPSNADGYSFLDIHYYFEGNSHNVGHSEKTLTIVGTKANLNKLAGVATSGSETGLYAFLKDTGVTVKKSDKWG